MTVIKIAGSLYLVWLAYKASRSAAVAHDIVPTTRRRSPAVCDVQSVASQSR
jgi:threonine/homoserine/homoserine lactone efflux protein